MKTKKFSLSEKLESLYRVVMSLSNLVEKQEQELKDLRLEINYLSEKIQQLEAIIKEMPTQKLDR
ncbi:MAG: hypothetical protein WAQ98_23365 [Blastocatellia bacterium]